MEGQGRPVDHNSCPMTLIKTTHSNYRVCVWGRSIINIGKIYIIHRILVVGHKQVNDLIFWLVSVGACRLAIIFRCGRMGFQLNYILHWTQLMELGELDCSTITDNLVACTHDWLKNPKRRYNINIIFTSIQFPWGLEMMYILNHFPPSTHNLTRIDRISMFLAGSLCVFLFTICEPNH